jgi:hypothetical protein
MYDRLLLLSSGVAITTRSTWHESPTSEAFISPETTYRYAFFEDKDDMQESFPVIQELVLIYRGDCIGFWQHRNMFLLAPYMNGIIYGSP